MRAQAYEFIRQQLIMATADLSGSTKGQLQAWLEDAQFDTTSHPRKKPRVLDEVSGKMITLDNPPIPGKQSRAKGSHIPLVLPVEFVMASWRRAVLARDKHEGAWLMWCYADSTAYAHQVEIVGWGWEELIAGLEGKRVAGKTFKLLRSLLWLAAQDVKREARHGAEKCYKAQELALMVGVSKSTWSGSYAGYWSAMRGHFLHLDRMALEGVRKTRSKQRAINHRPAIANPN